MFKFYVTFRLHPPTIKANTQYMKGDSDMKKIIIRKKDATLFERFEEHFVEYLADLVIMGAFIFMLSR